MTSSHGARVREIGERHPEWRPWLSVVNQSLSEAASERWQPLVPKLNERQHDSAPLLAGMTLALDAALVRRWAHELFAVAAGGGTEKLSALKAVKLSESEALALFESSLCQDRTRLSAGAAEFAVDADAWEAVALLLPIPLLHACERKWSTIEAPSWMAGYCRTCGAWPALAEVRGIERSHYFRCGRCGGGWQAQCLLCPYCGMTDHEQLASLMPENDAENAVINVCKRCLGYVKTFTSLQARSGAAVMLDDLASVDFDVVALEQGFKRPQGLGYALNLTITP